MSCVLALITLLAVSAIVIAKCDVSFAQVIPAFLCGVMLVLFFLAFFDALWLIDWIEASVCIACLLYGICLIQQRFIRETRSISAAGSQGTRPQLALRLKRGFCNPATVAILLVVVIVGVGMHGVQIVAYDDFKFWAASVKSLFFQGGYGAPYTNVGSQYGDYPQGIMLVLWWAEHLRGAFRENVLYIAFTLFTVSFLFPLFKGIKKYPSALIVTLIFLTFNSAFTLFGVSLEPDRVMAVAYGASLVAALSYAKSKNPFYAIQFVLFICSVALMKSVGILWSLFAILFCFAIQSSRTKTPLGKHGKELRGSASSGLLYRARVPLVGLLAVLVLFLTWNVYCLYVQRTTYLTQEMFSSLSLSPQEALDHAASYGFVVELFCKILFLLPANCANLLNAPWPLSGLSLSPVAYLLLFVVLGIVAISRAPHSKRTVLVCLVFCLVVALVYYAVLLWSYLFMFYAEFTPSSIDHMQNMTSHYAEPILCGAIMLIVALYLSQDWKLRRPRWVGAPSIIFCILLVIPNYWGTYTLLFGQDLPVYYYHDVVAARAPRETQVTPLATQIEADVASPTHARVFIADTSLSNEGYCYLHYLLAPISTIDYMPNKNSEDKGVAEINGQAQNILDSIIETHCNYAYFGNTYAEQLAAIGKDQDPSLAPNTLYCVETTGGVVSFAPVG